MYPLKHSKECCTFVYVYVQSLSHVQLFVAPWTVAYHQLCLWVSLGENTEVGCQFLLQGIFPTR